VGASSFDDVVAVHRRELLAHCYRMLGSLPDAEDALQESLVRAWKSPRRPEPIRPWLFKIATNRCLTMLSQRSRRASPVELVVSPFPDPAEEAERQEGVELAFVAALQELSPVQRAVLVLREVLGFSAAEVADQLDTTVAAVNSGLQRARQVLPTRRPAIVSSEIKTLADRYAAAWEAADVDTLVGLFAADAKYSMPPLPECYRGRDAIHSWLLSGPLRHRWHFRPARANGQIAFGTYLWQDDAWQWAALDVLSFDGGRVAEVVSFLDADPAVFGLPPTAAAPPP
jgi:RNA polymerase sigma factor (sigma-70 family)